MRKLVVLAVALTVALIPGGTSWSGPERAKSSWTSETEGSPVATIDGGWSVTDGGVDRVDFRGPHVVGARTTFEARWLSPWVRVTSARPAEIATEGGLEYVQAPATAVEVAEQVRVREKGGRWSRWFGFRLPNEGTWGGVLWASASMSVSSGKPRARNLRFEWRLVGEAEAVSHLEGWAEVHLLR